MAAELDRLDGLSGTGANPSTVISRDRFGTEPLLNKAFSATGLLLAQAPSAAFSSKIQHPAISRVVYRFFYNQFAFGCYLKSPSN